MKNILLPTDFSKNSINAIDYAMHFFKNWECNFYILNVQKHSEYISADLVAGSKSDSIFDSIAADNKKLINQLVKKLCKNYKSQSYTFHGLFDYDDFIAAVNQAVTFNAIDLIIMGSNGATGAKEVVFGSNTLLVVRNLECPTLTIPENYTYTSIKNALFSTHRCKDLSSNVLNIFKDMLNIHQCELNVLEFDDDATIVPRKEVSKCMQSIFPENPYSYYHLNTVPGMIALNTTTQLLNIDLHAVCIEKETFLERVLFGSETTKLVYGTMIPLLFLHR